MAIGKKGSRGLQLGGVRPAKGTPGTGAGPVGPGGAVAASQPAALGWGDRLVGFTYWVGGGLFASVLIAVAQGAKHYPGLFAAMLGWLFFYGLIKLAPVSAKPSSYKKGGPAAHQPVPPVAAAAAPSANFSTEAGKMLAEARQRIETIGRNNDAIADEEISERLDRIYTRTHKLVDLLTEDHSRVRQGRAFLKFQLDSVVKITTQYAEFEARGQSAKFRDRLLTLLDNVEHQLAKTTDDIFRGDAADLDMAMDVLEADLQQGGLR